MTSISSVAIPPPSLRRCTSSYSVFMIFALSLSCDCVNNARRAARGDDAHLVARDARRRARHDEEQRLAHRAARRVHGLARLEAHAHGAPPRPLRALLCGRSGERVLEEDLADPLPDEAEHARLVPRDLGEQRGDAVLHVREGELGLLGEVSGVVMLVGVVLTSALGRSTRSVYGYEMRSAC